MWKKSFRQSENMDTLEYIAKKFGIRDLQPSRIEIPDVGRNNLAHLFRELGFLRGVEVGVREGKFSEILCMANPEAEIFGVDPYSPYRDFEEWITTDNHHAAKRSATRRLAPYNWKLLEMTSLQAADLLRNGNPIDFVYIDANHDQKYVAEDIEAWSKVVRSGGIMSGHDWGDYRPLIGVKRAIQAYVRKNKVGPVFLFGRKNVGAGEFRERYRSWMWVNP